ncbi:MAG: hypothetical protein ACLFSQ_10675 [Candidatus Zixiibacteriota bacterium]
MIHGRDAKHCARREFQREKDVVVITDEPPELCISQIPVGQ